MAIAGFTEIGDRYNWRIDGITDDETYIALGGSDEIWVRGQNNTVMGDYDVFIAADGGSRIELGADLIVSYEGDATVYGEGLEIGVFSDDSDAVIVDIGDDRIIAYGGESLLVGDAVDISLYSSPGQGDIVLYGGDDEIYDYDGDGTLFGDSQHAQVLLDGGDSRLALNFGFDHMGGGSLIYGDCETLTITAVAGSTGRISVVGGTDQIFGEVSSIAEVVITDDVIYGDVATVELDIAGGSVRFLAGSDAIAGDGGNDTIWGDVGEFIVDGVSSTQPPPELEYISGSDRFIFAAESADYPFETFGDDVLMDFEVGKDLLVFSGFDWGFDALTISVTADGVLIDATVDSYDYGSILLAGVDAVDQSSFVFL